MTRKWDHPLANGNAYTWEVPTVNLTLTDDRVALKYQIRTSTGRVIEWDGKGTVTLDYSELPASCMAVLDK